MTAAEWARTFRQQPLLSRIALSVALSTATLLVLDYCFKSSVARSLPGPQIGPFVARYYLALNVLSLVVQVFLSSAIVRRLGVTAAIVLTPLLLMLGAAGVVATGGRSRGARDEGDRRKPALLDPPHHRGAGLPAGAGPASPALQAADRRGARARVADRRRVRSCCCWVGPGPWRRGPWPSASTLLAAAWLADGREHASAVSGPAAVGHLRRVAARGRQPGAPGPRERAAAGAAPRQRGPPRGRGGDERVDAARARGLRACAGPAAPRRASSHAGARAFRSVEPRPTGCRWRAGCSATVARVCAWPRRGRSRCTAAWTSSASPTTSAGECAATPSIDLALRDGIEDVLEHDRVAALLREKGDRGEAARLGMLAAIADAPRTPALVAPAPGAERATGQSPEHTELLARAAARQHDPRLVPALVERLSAREGREAVRTALVSFGDDGHGGGLVGAAGHDPTAQLPHPRPEDARAFRHAGCRRTAAARASRPRRTGWCATSRSARWSCSSRSAASRSTGVRVERLAHEALVRHLRLLGAARGARATDDRARARRGRRAPPRRAARRQAPAVARACVPPAGRRAPARGLPSPPPRVPCPSDPYTRANAGELLDALLRHRDQQAAACPSAPGHRRSQPAGAGRARGTTRGANRTRWTRGGTGCACARPGPHGLRPRRGVHERPFSRSRCEGAHPGGGPCVICITSASSASCSWRRSARTWGPSTPWVTDRLTALLEEQVAHAGRDAVLGRGRPGLLLLAARGPGTAGPRRTARRGHARGRRCSACPTPCSSGHACARRWR